MALATGTPSTSGLPSDFHVRLDELDDQMHLPKGYRNADNGTSLMRGANGEIEYAIQNPLPAVLSFDSGAGAPSTEVDGDIYILSSSFIASLTCTTIAWQSGTTVRYSFSGSPDLSTVTTAEYLVISAAGTDSNNGRFVISTVNDGSDYIEVTNANRTDATDDESAITATTDISYRDWDGAIKNEWIKYNGTDDLWYRIVPIEGLICYIKDEDVIYKFDGSTWTSFAGAYMNTVTSTDNAIPSFDGTTGQVQNNTNVTIDDSDTIHAAAFSSLIDALPTDTATIDIDSYPLIDGTFKKLTAGNTNITLNQTTVYSTDESVTWYLEFTQDATTARTLTLGTNFLEAGTTLAVSTTLEAVDLLEFVTMSDGKSFLKSHRQGIA